VEQKGAGRLVVVISLFTVGRSASKANSSSDFAGGACSFEHRNVPWRVANEMLQSVHDLRPALPEIRDLLVDRPPLDAGPDSRQNWIASLEAAEVLLAIEALLLSERQDLSVLRSAAPIVGGD